MNEKEVEYTNRISEIKQSIADLKTLQDSNDIYLVSTYKPRNDIFRRVPTKLIVPSPVWVPVKKIKIHEQFGYVVWSSLIETEEQGYMLKPTRVLSFLPDRTLIDVPRIIANTDIQQGLRKVSCVDNEQFWTCGLDKFMRLYNVYNDSMTKNGDLIYTDPGNSTVNIVTNTQRNVVIRLKKWTPSFICCSSSGDFMVVMDNFDDEQTKIVRYSGSTEKQTIQFDAQGRRIFMTALYCNIDCTKNIVKNKNLDICVAGVHENAIIVVNRAGELRFRYTGISKPFDITTDNQGRILAVESHENRIYILEQDSQFLRYIDNCGLVTPWSLSVDNDDKLLVMTKDNGNVKKIQYCL